MKKSEIYLLFTTLLIGLSILLVALFQYVKPSKTTIVLDDMKLNQNGQYKQYSDNGWIDKISKNNQNFSYPVTIYKLKL